MKIDKRTLKRTGKYIDCIICQTKRYYPANRFKRWVPKFCSNLCKYQDFRDRNKPKYGYKNCEVCSKPFYYPPAQQRKGQRFCSLRCRGKIGVANLGTRMLGKKHTKKTRLQMSKNSFCWKGGITKINHSIRSMTEYKEWVKIILKRDNFSCVECGISISGKMQIHHKVSLSQIIDLYKLKTLIDASACEFLWNTENGITLCLKCHCKLDKYAKRFVKDV